MMTRVHCYGALAEVLPDPVMLDVRTAREAVKALCVMVPGFERRLIEGRWHVLRGGEPLRDPSHLDLPPGASVRVVPEISGSGGSTGSAVLIGLGIVLIGAAILVAPPAGAVAAGAAGAATAAAASSIALSMGLSLAITGVAGLLTKTPKADTNTAKGSTLMGGAVNMVTSGTPVPLIYGRCRVGSIVASGGVTTVPLG